MDSIDLDSRRAADLEAEVAALRAELAAIKAQALAPADHEFRDPEERLRAALAGSGAGTFRWDFRADTLDWDIELDRIFGLEPGVTSRSLAEFIARVHADDRPLVVAACERCRDEGVDFEMSFRVLWPDGSVHWIFDRGKTYHDEAGRPAYMTGACLDVTERHEQLDQLWASEERSRLAEEAGGVGVFEWYPQTGEVYASDQYRRIWGIEQPNPLRDQDMLAFVHPDDRRFSGVARSADLPAALDYAEYRIIRPDTGEQRWIARRGRMIESADGGPPRMIGVCYDVTERRLAESRLRAVLESMPDGFIGVDAGWRITLFNRVAEQHFRMTREEAVGRPFWDAFPYAVGSPIEHAVREVMTTRQHRIIEVGSLIAPDRFFELRIAPKQEGGGIAIGFSDVTLRRRAEHHRELLVNELNHRVKNTLALVQATAHQTLRRGAVPAEVSEAFEGRLAALAGAHDILTHRNWEAAYLHEVLEKALAPFAADAEGRITCDGPELRLEPKCAVSFALAVHELATNACKYGALSNDAGQVRVVWRLASIADEARLKLVWRETGGPPVRPPTSRGFGSRMIERGLALELGGPVKIDYAPEGVTCAIEAPLEYLDQTAARRLEAGGLDGRGGGA